MRLALLMLPSLGLCSGTSCLDWPAPQSTVPLFNFHVLDPGKAYRSGQPDAQGLRIAITDLGLRTVLNLRGNNAGKDWFDAEKAVCDEMGVPQINVAMSASSLPSAEVMGQILDALRTAERPMLIHCQAGADRAGAVAAIYRITILGDDKATAAAEELTPLKFHFRAFTPCMDTLVEMFEPTTDWLSDYAAVVEQTPCTP